MAINRTISEMSGLATSSRLVLQLELLRAVADLAALRTSIVTITAKLDLDAGVTDTNYAALCNPVANTFVA